MTTGRRALALAGLLLVVFSTAACNEPFGEINKIDFSQLLRSAGLSEAMNVGFGWGRTLLLILVPIWLLLCWGRAMRGEPWVDIVSDGVIGLMVCAWIMSYGGTAGGDRLFGHAGDIVFVKSGEACNAPVGSFQGLIHQVGRCLGDLYGEGKGGADGHGEFVRQLGDAIQSALEGLQQTTDSSDNLAKLQGLRLVMASGVAIGFTVVNSVALDLLRTTMQVSWVFLIFIYSVLAPIVVPTVVMRETRDIFLGYLRAFLSVALWPFFMGLLETIQRGIPWMEWSALNPNTPLYGMDQIYRGELLLFLSNTVFLLMYIAIPHTASKIVSGANQAIKGGFF